MFVGVTPDVGPLPRTINVQVHWLVTDTAYTFDYSEQVHLSMQPSGTAWEGTTIRHDQATTISVHATMDPTVFEITAVLKAGATTVRTANFNHVQPVGVTRWDTGLLVDVQQAGFNETSLRLLA